MNVRQLVEALSALDPDLPVMMPSRVGSEFAHVDEVFLDVVVTSKYGGLELCDYEDDGCVTVARLFETGDYDDRKERPKPPTS